MKTTLSSARLFSPLALAVVTALAAAFAATDGGAPARVSSSGLAALGGAAGGGAALSAMLAQDAMRWGAGAPQA